MGDLVIRPATAADLAGAEAVRLACFPHVFDVAMGRGAEARKVRALVALRECRPDPLAGLVVAVVAGSVVGCTSWVTDDDVLGPVTARARAALRTLGPLRTLRMGVVRQVGFLHVDVGPDEAYVSDIAVLPEHRGRRIAEHLVRAAEERSASLGASRWVALVADGNEASFALLARLGYERTATVRHPRRGRLMGEGDFARVEHGC